MIPGFRSVTKRNPCPLCQRPDWCLIRHDRAAVICPRTVSARQWGEAGFFHVIDENTYRLSAPSRAPMQIPPCIDAGRISEGFELAITAEQIRTLAANLGVSAQSLCALNIGWSDRHDAFTFPMRNQLAQPIGIRLRKIDGFKFAVSGSRNGLFIPGIQWGDEVWIVEGPTDCAAALTLELPAIGRPSCSAAVDMTVGFCRGKSVTIIGNYDEPKTRPDGSTFYPGQDGTAVLADALAGAAALVRVIYPRTGKDVRQWLAAGATNEEVRAVADNAGSWTRRAA